MPPCHATCSLNMCWRSTPGMRTFGAARAWPRRRREVAAVRVLAVAAQRAQIGEPGRRVRIRAARDQQLDGVEASRSRRRKSAASAGDRLPSALTLAPASRSAAIAPVSPDAGGQHQRRRAGARLRVDRRAGADERLDDRRRSPLGREMQRRVGAEPCSRRGRSRRRRRARRPDRRRLAAPPSAAP